ncbi:DUF2863 family protein [Uliginosibacterium sp. 31-16]|uniref:DUF2863 family protein n=1 Tax=Uliginosibacterium sp. 31-16 TaxID=3068315 RepID=UPI00273ECD3C|nr:DUF2863 family protein [Uliginosibacterium sp. 31-16]MDP5239766.1 DUF2863 family protein [Uliginosibacterium sp. 31-16]
MKRSRFSRRSGLPHDADDILWLVNGLAESGSRAEDAFWELRLASAVDELLHSENEDTLITLLDQLQASNQRAYDVLADTIETRAEQSANEHGEILLIAAPVLAWSRFTIPAGTIPAKTLNNLRVHLQAHVLARDVKLGIANVLFSPDQLPQGYCDTARFTAQMTEATLAEGTVMFDAETLPETSRFLSDLRYVLAAVHVQPGAPIFRWQENGCSREQALEQWRAQGGACLQPMLAGCAMELELPDAYFAACRQADRASRPYSIRASTAFLSTTLDIAPSDLRAIVAPFYERQIEEYRIGFTTADSSAVVHGVVWPMLGPEDDAGDVPAQIDATLKDSGITRIEHLDNRFPLEFCDDCGAPMYPSPEGEAVHAELPEDKAEQVPKHLH